MRLVLLSLAAIGLSHFLYASDDKTLSDIRMKALREATYKDVDIYDSGRILLSNSIPVCVFRPANGDHMEIPMVNIDDHTNVEDYLSSMVKLFPNYDIKYLDGHKMIYMLSDAQAVMDWTIDSLVVEDMSFFEAVVERDLLGLKTYRIVFWDRMPWGRLDTKVSLEVANRTAFDCLGLLMAQVPGVCWTITESGTGYFNMVFNAVSTEAKLRGNDSAIEGEKLERP